MINTIVAYTKKEGGAWLDAVALSLIVETDLPLTEPVVVDLEPVYSFKTSGGYHWDQKNGWNHHDKKTIPPALADTLQERGKRYGPFSGHASITQDLKNAMKGLDGCDTNWNLLSSSQKEALEMIAHKIGRILNGDPNYDDSWIDIAGYAQLVVDQLHGKDT